MVKGLSVLVAFLLIFSFADAQSNGTKAVRDAFESYRTAILNDQGEQAAKLVDKKTIKYYSDILEKVKNSDSVTISSLPLLDKLMVLIIRHKTSKEEILSFDGTKLLIYAIEKGMVGKNGVANNTIGEVTINGNFAKGQLVVNKQKSPYFFHFHREENKWKLDLTSIFPIGNIAFKKMIKDSGQPENEFIFTLLENMTGKRPTAEIWVPIAI